MCVRTSHWTCVSRNNTNSCIYWHCGRENRNKHVDCNGDIGFATIARHQTTADDGVEDTRKAPEDVRKIYTLDTSILLRIKSMIILYSIIWSEYNINSFPKYTLWERKAFQKHIEFTDFRSNWKGISIKRNSSPVHLLNRKLLASTLIQRNKDLQWMICRWLCLASFDFPLFVRFFSLFVFICFSPPANRNWFGICFSTASLDKYRMLRQQRKWEEQQQQKTKSNQRKGREKISSSRKFVMFIDDSG